MSGVGREGWPGSPVFLDSLARRTDCRCCFASSSEEETKLQGVWIRACKGGVPACSNFNIAAQYTEWLVLGAAAARVEGKLLYDAKTGLFTNNKDANKYLDMTYRKGWEVTL
jgi:hypothetical protein